MNWRAASMSTSPTLDIFSVNLATIESNSLSVPITFKCAEKNQTVETLGLVDCGAGGKFINQDYTRKISLKTKPLKEPIIARNVDGTENKLGKMTHFVDLDLTIHDKKMKTRLLVSGLGKQNIILGFPWLHEHNPFFIISPLRSMVRESISIALGSQQVKWNRFFGSSFFFLLESFRSLASRERPKILCIFLQLLSSLAAQSYHSLSVLGGFSRDRIRHCNGKLRVSR